MKAKHWQPIDSLLPIPNWPIVTEPDSVTRSCRTRTQKRIQTHPILIPRRVSLQEPSQHRAVVSVAVVIEARLGVVPAALEEEGLVEGGSFCPLNAGRVRKGDAAVGFVPITLDDVAIVFGQGDDVVVGVLEQ